MSAPPGTLRWAGFRAGASTSTAGWRCGLRRQTPAPRLRAAPREGWGPWGAAATVLAAQRVSAPDAPDVPVSGGVMLFMDLAAGRLR